MFFKDDLFFPSQGNTVEKRMIAIVIAENRIHHLHIFLKWRVTVLILFFLHMHPVIFFFYTCIRLHTHAHLHSGTVSLQLLFARITRGNVHMSVWVFLSAMISFPASKYVYSCICVIICFFCVCSNLVPICVSMSCMPMTWLFAAPLARFRHWNDVHCAHTQKQHDVHCTCAQTQQTTNNKQQTTNNKQQTTNKRSCVNI